MTHSIHHTAAITGIAASLRLTRRLLLAAAALLLALAAMAEGAISHSGLIMLRRAQGSRAALTQNICAIVQATDPEYFNALNAIDGVSVDNIRGDLALVTMPLETAPQVAAAPGIVRVDFGRKVQPLLDKARPASYAQPLIDGLTHGFTKNYRGAGILVGMMDEGIDPNHINFYTADGTRNRITSLSVITGTSAAVRTYDTPSAILSYTTDKPEATHATHVLGIMAGAYNGPGDYADVTLNPDGSLASIDLLQNHSLPFYGLASEAEINAFVGDLYEANILKAAEMFAAQAKASGKPGVFNLSVGLNIGPHDGTDNITRYMANIGKDVIICISSGNEGDKPMSITHTSSGSTPLKTLIETSQTSDGAPHWGESSFDIWASNNSEITVRFSIVNKSTGAEKWGVDIPVTGADKALFVGGTATDYNHFPAFNEAFTDASWFGASNSVSSDNNRTNVTFTLDLTAKSADPTLVPAISVKANSGVKVNAYASSGLTFGSGNLSGYTQGNPDQSINDFACGKNVIVVGAYCSKYLWPTLDEKAYSLVGLDNNSLGTVSAFTSYGTLPDGRSLPDLSAPGEVIISSVSDYCFTDEAEAASNSTAVALSTVNTPSGTERTNYWMRMQGTSMASPYVAGAAALLLEADNTLGVADIRSLLTSTAHKPTGVTPAASQQWGAGAIVVEAAMRKLLGMPSAIGDISADTDRRFAMSIGPDAIEVTVAGENALTASLHSIAGLAATSAESTGDALTLSTVGLPAGVYVLSVTTADGDRITRKITLQR